MLLILQTFNQFQLNVINTVHFITHPQRNVYIYIIINLYIISLIGIYSTSEETLKCFFFSLEISHLRMANDEQTDAGGKYGMSGRGEQGSGPKYWPTILKGLEFVSFFFFLSLFELYTIPCYDVLYLQGF